MTMEQQLPTSPTAPTTSKSSPSVIHGNHSNPENSGEGGSIVAFVADIVGDEEVMFWFCLQFMESRTKETGVLVMAPVYGISH